jgi:hypothetical protein
MSRVPVEDMIMRTGVKRRRDGSFSSTDFNLDVKISRKSSEPHLITTRSYNKDISST